MSQTATAPTIPNTNWKRKIDVDLVIEQVKLGKKYCGTIAFGSRPRRRKSDNRDWIFWELTLSVPLDRLEGVMPQILGNVAEIRKVFCLRMYLEDSRKVVLSDVMFKMMYEMIVLSVTDFYGRQDVQRAQPGILRKIISILPFCGLPRIALPVECSYTLSQSTLDMIEELFEITIS